MVRETEVLCTGSTDETMIEVREHQIVGQLKQKQNGLSAIIKYNYNGFRGKIFFFKKMQIKL